MRKVKIINDFLKGQISENCYMVERGKPSSVVAVKNINCTDAIKLVNEHGLKHELKNLDDNWNSLWIYKHEYMSEVINSLPAKPETLFDHWLLGKAFGYSEEAISDYLKMNRRE